MASRGGPRAEGTDGSDFTHRQRVAAHYVESVRLKNKLKFSILLHLLLVACVALWAALAGIGKVPNKPEPWELAWLLSTIPALVGLACIPKSNINGAYIYAFGTLLMGIGPLSYGAAGMAQEVVMNMSKRRMPATGHWQNLPMKMALVAFVIQLHGIGIYFANKLIGVWGSRGDKKAS